MGWQFIKLIMGKKRDSGEWRRVDGPKINREEGRETGMVSGRAGTTCRVAIKAVTPYEGPPPNSNLPSCKFPLLINK